MGVIERKVLGALLILSDENKNVEATKTKIADTMGYKEPGGAISFALQILERDNWLVKTGIRSYKLLV
ncbi:MULTISPECIES: hypothetical protein [unclassified Dehalobacter]|uniref:hypothetical protein n=1 Tax=unclassified Dehalobacter TaxID=2635733 RepID=UPI0003A129D6|nr:MULTISPECIES: hypothetical protein [unclassified Dehalobacter]RJE47703.1 hypothetical protein A7K50_03380 [Dehalobacter sp. MCB1]TCX53802.1 hypothetical protein C1I36_03465 [Dehalobacter sp. 14DCB1]